VAILQRLARRLRALRHGAQMERDLRDELHEHLERSIDELVAGGLTREAARAEAVRAFGGLAQAEEACRDARGVRLLTEFVQDLRYGVRILRSTPALTLVIVFTLAIAIGANTALFSLFDAVLLKSLPLPHPERLVVISEETPSSHGPAVSYQDFLDWRARQTAFEDIAASMVIGGVLTGGGDPDRVFGRAVTREFFTILGTGFELGRPFTDAEERPNGPRAIVLSHALWNRRYGGDRTVAGRPVVYNGEPYTIVGVLPATFDYYGTTNANNDIFLPLGRQASEHYMLKRDSRPGLSAIARMKPGVTIERARADLSRVAAALAVEYPSTNANVSVAVRSMVTPGFIRAIADSPGRLSRFSM